MYMKSSRYSLQQIKVCVHAKQHTSFCQNAPVTPAFEVVDLKPGDDKVDGDGESFNLLYAADAMDGNNGENGASIIW